MPTPSTSKVRVTIVSDCRPLAIVAGTSVPQFAAGFLYQQFERLAPDARTFALSMLGLAHSRSSSLSLQPRIEQFLDGRVGDLLGDSQGGYPAIHYAYHHPEQVQHLVLLSVPLDGTPAAHIIDTPGTRCMRPGSRYVEHIREMAKELAESPDGPSITCISSGHDFLVPHGSAFLHSDSSKVRNICLAHSRAQGLHEAVELVEVWDGHFRMHISEIFLRDTGRVVAEVLGYADEPAIEASPHESLRRSPLAA